VKSLAARVAALPLSVRHALIRACEISRECRHEHVMAVDVRVATYGMPVADRAAIYALFGYTPFLGRVNTPLMRECVGVRCAINRRAGALPRV